MILSFNPQFIESILQGSKIHTIREDKTNRWGAGRIIQAATGVRTKYYKQFFTSECKDIQEVCILIEHKNVIIYDGRDQTYLCPESIERLAKNDGFKTVEDFWQWFDKPFKGKIIHWTNFKY